MATKPTVANASFATDANFSSGPAAGTPTKVAPVSIAAQGWRPDDALGFVGAWFNYLLNQAFLWFTYLDDLHNSSDFLNKSYTWITGTHTFSATVNHASTTNLSGASNEVTYTSARTRTVPIPLAAWVQGQLASADWALGSNSELVTDVAGQVVVIDVPAPQGCTITAVTAQVKPNGTWTTNFLFNLTSITWNHALGSPTRSSAITGTDSKSTATTSAGTSDVLGSGTIAETPTGGKTYQVRITSPDGATPTGSLIESLLVSYTETRATGSV